MLIHSNKSVQWISTAHFNNYNTKSFNIYSMSRCGVGIHLIINTQIIFYVTL